MASWVVNIILAFVLVKFIIYPGLGLLLGTSLPVVAVVSGSMEHDHLSFDQWWYMNKDWYFDNDISRDDFVGFPFRNGFDKGDIMILFRVNAHNTNIGDVVVYQLNQKSQPIIHRVVKKDNNLLEFKGDNNPTKDHVPVPQDKLVGKAVFTIPFLGWVKIIFVDYLVKPILGGMS